MKRFLFALAGLGLLLGLSGLWARPGDVEADPSRDYAVTPEAGPWLILAATFTKLPEVAGPEPAELAHDLALYIRQHYKMPAWVFNHGAEERAEQERRIAEIQKEFAKLGATRGEVGPRIRRHRIQEQYAVLIGGYKDMETARKDLDRIKKLPPPDRRFCSLISMEGPAPGQANGTSHKALESPFDHSFVVRNPTVPREQKPQNESTWDPFIKELNADEPLSLLKCRKRYTLVIKDFQGGAQAILGNDMKKTTFIDKLLGRGSGDGLTASAMQAQAFAKALRSMKEEPLETYVLHTRYASFVTVGGFDALDDPRMTEARMKLSKLQQFMIPAAPGGGLMLWAQPLPMEIPRF